MKRWIYALVPLLGLLALIAWRMETKKSESETQATQQAARKNAAAVVSLAEVKTRAIVRTFAAVGTVESPFNVRIAPRITGQILYLTAREGDHIKKGETLVRIDDTDVQGAIRQRQAEFEGAKFRLEQARFVEGPTNASVSAGIRQQEAAVASTDAEMKQAKSNYASLIAGSQANIADMQGRINNATATIANTEAAIKSAEANLANARVRYNRMKELLDKGFIAAQAADDARTTVDVRAAEVDLAKTQRDSAIAQRDSAVNQKKAAEEQSKIGKNKGDTDIAAATAKWQQAKAALDYARSNAAQQPAYKQNLSALQSAVEAASAALRSARSRLEDTVLLAPLDGVVNQRLTDPGAMASPGQTILVIQNSGQLWLTVPVPEEESRSIRTGQPAQITFDALPGKTFAGRVVQLNPAADPLSRQFLLRVSLENPQNLLKPGMYGRLQMEIERIAAAVMVPREAVQTEGEKAFVYVVGADNIAHKRAIMPGTSDTNGIAIQEGLKPGEKVVTLSAMPLKEGQIVKVSQ